MSRVIIFEETIRIKHKIIADYSDICDLHSAINETWRGMCLDECVEIIDNAPGVSVKKVIDNYKEDSEGIECIDDYEENEK